MSIRAAVTRPFGGVVVGVLVAVVVGDVVVVDVGVVVAVVIWQFANPPLSNLVTILLNSDTCRQSDGARMRLVNTRPPD